MSRHVKAVAPQKLKLTADESRILQAYRALNRGGKEDAMSTLEAWAEMPSSRPAPALRLLIGGAA